MDAEHPPQSAPPRNTVRREALTGLSEALTVLAGRLRARAAASDDFIRLTDRAKAIAGQAWEVRTSRWGFVENVGKLAEELDLFARHAASAATRATAETAGNMAVAHALIAQAGRIATLRQSPGAGSDHEIRAELQPLEATLTTMHEHATDDSTVSADAAALARRAAELATMAHTVRNGGRAGEEAVAQIGKSLVGFIEDANVIATRLSIASTGLSESAARMALGAREANRRLGRPHEAGPVARVLWTLTDGPLLPTTHGA